MSMIYILGFAIYVYIFPLFWDGSGIWVIQWGFFDPGVFSGIPICPFVCFLFLFSGCEFGVASFSSC
ncbi:unnamed protein product [Citrullus colocynthis]|uniref:Uncharacterized protein n=1 Tax=Citrullus colocynthis TaxID=252529 RepID=A0ABP0Y0F9_9ROSI